jgi:hypothetical protein
MGALSHPPTPPLTLFAATLPTAFRGKGISPRHQKLKITALVGAKNLLGK